MLATSLNRYISTREFIILMAMLTSFKALCIDMVLPALGFIAQDMTLTRNLAQLIVPAIFLGSAVGVMASGILADHYGRRSAIFIFMAILLLGTITCALAPGFDWLLVGRLLQGFGAAGPQNVALAILRDCFNDRPLAQMTSYMLCFFIVLTVLAPIFGQMVLLIANWRTIFLMLGIIYATVLVWFAFRQAETLPSRFRSVLSISQLWYKLAETARNRQLLLYTLMQAVMLGAFIGYLSSTQQILAVQYGLGPWFAVVFAGLSAAIGIAAFVNGMLVLRFGMHGLVQVALVLTLALSSIWLAVTHTGVVTETLASAIAWMVPSLFCIGLIFSNFSALAMASIENNKGMAAGVYGGGTAVLAAPIGTLVGQAYENSMTPVVTGFVVGSALSLCLIALHDQKS